MAARGLKKALRWFPHSTEDHHHLEEDEGSNERRGLLRSHLEQVVPVTDLDEEPNTSSSAVKEPKTVALKVSMHCHCCARKVEKQILKMEGVVSFKVELENKKVTVVGNVNPMEVLESICKVMKSAQILAAA
uniref:HMA domain-containing protein n=1 Tax=Oryza meridionalis TaxID=40149 RepID=A0A0E0C3T8_9ORYZ